MKFRQHLSALYRRIITKSGEVILGRHPNNTIFSFNYHNVSHINQFLNKTRQHLSQDHYVLVDIGAGKSPYYSLFAQQAKQYISVDTADSLPKGETRPIKQVVGFAEALPLEAASADVILCNQVLEHVQDATKAVSEMYRVLTPGGQCIGSVPHISPVHLEPYDFRRYTDLGLEQLLKEAGFTDIVIEGSGGVYSAATLLIVMDWVLTTRKSGELQGFSTFRALFLAPVVGFLNVISQGLDRLLGNKHRSPANLCWLAKKPQEV